MRQQWGDDSGGSHQAQETPLTAGALNHALLAELRCPYCAGNLGLEGHLLCASCARQWPVEERTPLFTNKQAVDYEHPLLRAISTRSWDAAGRALAVENPRLHAEAFDFTHDDWQFLLPIPAHARVLVLGCGWGRWAAALGRICRLVVAVESDPTRALFVNARARAEHLDNLLAIAAEGPALPLPTGSFHLVIIEDPAWGVDAASPEQSLCRLTAARALLAEDGALLMRCGPTRNPIVGKRQNLLARRLMAEAGLARVESILTLPGYTSNTYVLRTGGKAPLASALRMVARYYLEPKTPSRRVTRALLLHTPVPRVADRLLPEQFLLGLTQDEFRPGAFADETLPTGAEGSLAVRGRPCAGARVHYVAFDPATTRPRYIGKVARDPEFREKVHGEFDMLQQLHRILSPEMAATIPPALAKHHALGKPAAAQGHLEGRTLTSRLQETPRWLIPFLASRFMEDTTAWLIRFHTQTARPTILTEALLDEHILRDIRRCRELFPLSAQISLSLSALRSSVQRLVGQQFPLVCEHRDLWARNVLAEGRRIRVIDWDMALPVGLPLCDLYQIANSLALWVIGTQGVETRHEEMLQAAYSGKGRFSRTVAACVHAYCKQLALPAEWARLLLPVLLIRFAVMHEEHLDPGIGGGLLNATEYYLANPKAYPAAIGLRQLQR